MNPVAIRLLNQQLIAPQFSTPTEVVSYMGAMQAQEYRMMRRTSLRHGNRTSIILRDNPRLLSAPYAIMP